MPARESSQRSGSDGPSDVPGVDENFGARAKRFARNARIELAALNGEGGLIALARSSGMPERYTETLTQLYDAYKQEVTKKYNDLGIASDTTLHLFKNMLKIYAEELSSPFQFPSFHRAVRGPAYDYYALGNAYVHHLIDYSTSLALHPDRMHQIVSAAQNGQNVVLLSNHQSEADAAFMPLLAAPAFPELGESVIYIVGDRVVTDLLCKPFSMGRNLLCVHSKKRMDDDEAHVKNMKRRQNMRSVKEMERLLSEGGKILWLAPSGGRDRREVSTGVLEPDRFDPSNVEMIRKITSKDSMPTTRCFPMAMFTHDILPPPTTLQQEIGEERTVNFSKVGIGFGKEIDVENDTPDQIFEILLAEYWSMMELLASPANTPDQLPSDTCARPWQWDSADDVRVSAGLNAKASAA